MKKILVIADPFGSQQRTVLRAAELGARIGAKVDVAGFVYEHLASLPVQVDSNALGNARSELIAKHRNAIDQAIDKGGEPVRKIDVYWEKRVADRVIELVAEKDYDLLIKGGHRSETLTYTPTDWQLLRSCRVPVLLLSEKHWKKSHNVLAAVDLGTKVRSKLALNYKVVEQAAAMAEVLGSNLHVGYAVPFSKVLRDLGLSNRKQVQREGEQRAEKFRASLEERGVPIAGIHVATGAPDKVLINLAAENRAGLVVLGTVGRKKLVGRVLGNTAEQILRLLKADVLALKP
jgi:universal stress protein E